MPMICEEYAQPESFARLLSSIDAAWIEEALEATGAATVRKRRLPAEQVAWLVLGMALYRGWSISRVVSHLHLALPGESGRGVVPSAPVQARARLGDDRCAGSSSGARGAGRTRAPIATGIAGWRSTASTGRRCGHLIRQTIERTSAGSPVAIEERVGTRRRGS